jgi:hypothetical protein
MCRWLFALTAILVSAPVQADDPAHPGVLLGTGVIDIAGHSPYGPVQWCGELLFVQTDSGPQLVDPETHAVVSRKVPEAVRREPLYAGLFECTQAEGKTILWFDDGDASIIWQTIDGSDSGRVTGFFRVPFYGTPYFDVSDRMTAGVAAEGKEFIADRLPPGMKLLSVSAQRLQPPLTLDQVNGFSLLRDDLVEIVTSRDAVIGTNGITRQPQVGIAIVAQLDLRQTPPGIEHSVAIQDILPGSKNPKGPLVVAPDGLVMYVLGLDQPLEFPELVVASDGNVHFEIGEGADRKDCKLIGLSWGTPEVVCARMPEDFKTLFERILEQTKDWPSLSPSGRWVAWTEQLPIEGGKDWGDVGIYLAPTAELLKP